MEPQKKPIHLNENDTPYLYEPFRNQMPAKRPHPAEKEKIQKPWQGLLVFAFLMVLFNLAGIPLVLAGGMYGNALDEIIVFLIGSIPSEGKGQAHRGTSHTTSEWFRGFRLHPAFLMGTLLLTEYEVPVRREWIRSGIQ